MPKDDLFANRTLWLDREHMDIARERFWRAWLDSVPRDQWVFSPDQRRVTVTSVQETTERMHAVWEIAWAAAIAAYSFCAEGNLGPRSEEDK